MDILIIGNGFDLAHNLPTKYTNFLDFLENIRILKEEMPLNLEQFSDKIDENVQQYLFNSDSNHLDINPKHERYITEMYELSKDNLWIEWFQVRNKRNQRRNENWIDFESEMSVMIQILEGRKPNFGGDDELYEFQLSADAVYDFLSAKENTKNDSEEPYTTRIKNQLLEDLDKLIRCLEIYLEDFIKNIEIKQVSEDIYNLDIDRVLSFNYTDTYQKLYDIDVECAHIHGKADINNSIECDNMVLGIDDYLDEDEKFTNTNFIEFKKYYQRLIKGTNCDYKKWLDETKKTNENELINNKPEHNVYIFGHSLASTDRDILLEFINNDNTIITVFYNDNNQYSSQICNLVHLIGPDNLNKWVHQKKPRIKFVKQQPMIDIYDSEWRIMKDIRTCSELFKLSEQEIECKINEIKVFLCNSDKTYFRNQRNIIDLFVAITTSGYIDDNLTNQMLNMAKELYDPTKNEKFYPSEFKRVDNSLQQYKKIISDFIDSLNTYNADEKEKQYQISDSDSCEKISEYLTAGAKIGEQPAISLIEDILKGSNHSYESDEAMWSCVCSLICFVDQEKLIEIISDHISGDNNLYRIKYTYLLNLLKEKGYFDNIY